MSDTLGIGGFGGGVDWSSAGVIITPSGDVLTADGTLLHSGAENEVIDPQIGGGSIIHEPTPENKKNDVLPILLGFFLFQQLGVF